MPTSAYWNSQRKRGQDGRRSFFKQGTAHNDKLGFDWNDIEEHFAAADGEYTQHPEASAYKAFTQTFYDSLAPGLKGAAGVVYQHAMKVKDSFKMDSQKFEAALKKNDGYPKEQERLLAYPTEKI